MKTIGVLFISFLLHTLLLLGLFHTSIAHELAFFYRGLLYIFCTSALQILLLLSVRNRYALSLSSIIASVCIFMSLHSMFFTLVPVTLERSLSVFMLRQLDDKRQNSETKAQLETALINTFVLKNNAVAKRLQEQEQTGSIQQQNGVYTITNRGVWLVRMYGYIGTLFGLKQQSVK